MSFVARLDPIQLEIIMYLANGKQIEEIAVAMHRSRSDINRRIATARKRCHANTLPHLVSIAIASGALVWVDEQRAINGSRPDLSERPYAWRLSFSAPPGRATATHHTGSRGFATPRCRVLTLAKRLPLALPGCAASL
jgi:DNA-binding CsgD family transcriptional regulator